MPKHATDMNQPPGNLPYFGWCQVRCDVKGRLVLLVILPTRWKRFGRWRLQLATARQVNLQRPVATLLTVSDCFGTDGRRFGR